MSWPTRGIEAPFGPCQIPICSPPSVLPQPRSVMVCIPAHSGCPSAGQCCLGIRWEPPLLPSCLILVSLQLKVTHQTQVSASLPDGWNRGASFSSAVSSVEKSATCVGFLKCTVQSVVGTSIGNRGEFHQDT